MSWQFGVRVTTDRTKFRVMGKGRFDESNRHGNALDFYRDDYSLRMHGDGSGEVPALDLKRGVSPEWAPGVKAASGGSAQVGGKLK